MWSSRSLKFKLVSSYIICSLILLFVSALGIYAIRSTISDYNHVVTINMPNIEKVLALKVEVKDIHSILLQMSLPGNDSKELSRLHGKFDDAMAKFETIDKEYQAIPFADGEAEVYEQMSIAWKELQKHYQESFKILESNDSGKVASFQNLYLGDFQKARHTFFKSLDNLISFHHQQSTTWVAKATAVGEESTLINIVLAISGTLFSLIFGFILANSLSKSIRSLSDDLARGADELKGASHQVSTVSQTLSQNSSESASSLEEVVASLEEITSMVNKNAEDSKTASNFSSECQAVAQHGEKEVKNLMISMNEIFESSKKINDIINVIDDIAFQTNLLALNASVEAARAGEQGKGFSVVAEAVRTLALRSADAAKDITSLIKDTTAKVESGNRIAANSEKALLEIKKNIDKIVDINSAIANASQEQASGVSQIQMAVTQIDKTTQTNASASEEASASAEEMAAQAEQMQVIAFDLRKVIQGNQNIAA